MKKKSFKVIAGILALAFSFTTIQAQNDDQITEDELEAFSIEELLSLDVNIEIVSTKGDNIFNSPSTVTIISKEDIKTYGYLTISEALRTVAGFDVTRTYLKRGLATSRGIMQDHYANKTLILINGIPSWQAVTGEGNLDRININDVERIEVLKGPASVLYGTNAYSGAVNIVLKKEMTNTVEAHGSLGQNWSQDFGVNATFVKNDFRTFLSVNSSDNIGDENEWIDEAADTAMFNDRMRSQNVTLRTQYKDHSVLLNVYNVEESFMGVVPKYASGAGNDQLVQGITANYMLNTDLSEKSHLKAGFIYDFGIRNVARNADYSVAANILGMRYSPYVKFNYEISDKFGIELGADFDYRDGKEYRNYNVATDTTVADNGMTDKSVFETSGFTQISYKTGSFSLLGGARVTYNELFGVDVSPRATAVYTLNPKNSIKFMVGQSFRAPSLFELYFETSTGTVYGSPDLEPEKSTAFELAYLTSFDKIFIQALGYYAIYDNKIFRSTDSTLTLPDGSLNTGKVNVYTNGEAFNAVGVELEIKYANPKIVNTFVNYNFMAGSNGDKIEGIDHYNFKYVPVHTISAGVSKTFIDRLTLAGVCNFVSETEGGSLPVSVPVDAFTLIDLNLSYALPLESSKIVFSVYAKNLLDEKAMVPEYVRRKSVNEVPYGVYRHIGGSIKVKL